MNSQRTTSGPFRRPRNKPAARATFGSQTGFGSTGAGMSVSVSGMTYPSRLDDDGVVQLAKGAGEGSHHNPTPWGENAKDTPAVAMIAGTHEMTTATIGHTLAAELGETRAQLDRIAIAAMREEDTTLARIDQHQDAQRRKLELEAKLDREGLEVPKRVHGRGYYLAQAAIVFGDLTMISIVFQLLGLSDHLMFGVLPFTSALDIAASTSVFALVALAHYAGDHLRALLHGLERRRKAPRDGRANLPGISWVHLGLVVGLVACALAIVFGIGIVRADYLGAKHVTAEFVPFILLQLGVFAAAMALSYHHSHPYAKEYGETDGRAGEAEQEMEESCERHASVVGEYRALLHRSRTLLVQAVHHGELSAADVRRQIQLYMFEVRRHTGEPVVERLFALQSLPAPIERSQEELLTALMGPVELPELHHAIDIDKVMMRREECRQTLRQQKQEFDAANIDWAGIKRPATDAASSNGGTKG